MKTVLRIITSIVYIAWGIYSPLSAIDAIMSLNVSALISAGVGVLMLVAGVLGLIGIKKSTRRLFSVIILISSALPIITALPAFHISSLVTVAISVLYLLCI
ncbi:MAG: hypothetical protein E7589_07485 [Ruminococcaceae bacterium]|nr:hypothetical protein [Oscillospiraceae bacterium]